MLRIFQLLDSFPASLATRSGIRLFSTTINSLHDLPYPTGRPCAFVLEGDYLAMKTVGRIFLWNWRTDGACEIDPQGHEWVSLKSPRILEQWELSSILQANGAGFCMTLQPPFIAVIPCHLRTILYLRIPEMVSKIGNGLSLPIFPATESIEHQLLKRDIEGVLHISFRVLNTFAPVGWRSPNLAYLRVTQGSGQGCDIILEFPKSRRPNPPRVTRQARKCFDRIHPRSSRFMNDDTLFAISYPRHPHPSLGGLNANKCSIKSFRYITRRGNFVKPAEKDFRIDVHDLLWNSFSDSGTLCGVSGVAVLAGIPPFPEGSQASLGLVRFQ